MWHYWVSDWDWRSLVSWASTEVSPLCLDMDMPTSHAVGKQKAFRPWEQPCHPPCPCSHPPQLSLEHLLLSVLPISHVFTDCTSLPVPRNASGALHNESYPQFLSPLDQIPWQGGKLDHPDIIFFLVELCWLVFILYFYHILVLTNGLFNNLFLNFSRNWSQLGWSVTPQTLNFLYLYIFIFHRKSAFPALLQDSLSLQNLSQSATNCSEVAYIFQDDFSCLLTSQCTELLLLLLMALGTG